MQPETPLPHPLGNRNCTPKKSLDREVQSRMLRIAMKRNFTVLKALALAAAFCAVASLAAAHEHDTYKIGDKYYLITIGSVNEPFVVDKMSGVDLRDRGNCGPRRQQFAQIQPRRHARNRARSNAESGMAAGNKKETLAFDPSDTAPGAYTAAFIPTVQTTYSYRIFGTINSSPIDLTFTCVPGEGSETTEDNSQVKVSDPFFASIKSAISAVPSQEAPQASPNRRSLPMNWPKICRISRRRSRRPESKSQRPKP